MSEINLSNHQKRLQDIILGRKNGLLNNHELDKAIKHKRKIDEYHALKDLEVTCYHIIALYYFAKGKTNKQIKYYLRKNTINEVNEIIIRKEWMAYHKNNPKSTNLHYLCQVGTAVERKKDDREFYVLLKGIISLNKLHDAKYLYDQKCKNDPPDFVILDEHQNNLGIEITEAPYSQDFNKKNKDQEEFFQSLRTELSGLDVVITFKERIPWDEMNLDKQNIILWLKKVALETLENNTEQRVFVYNEKIRIKIKRSSDFLHLFDITDINGKSDGFRGNEDNLAIPSILNAIQRKAKIDPKVTPTDLWIYPNNDLLKIDYVEVAKTVDTTAIQHKFAAVYIVTEESIVKL